MSESNNRIRQDVAFCKEVAERIGLGCELPSRNAAVGSQPVLGMVQVFDSGERSGRDEWICTLDLVASDQALFGFSRVASG
jgi:hypothetical protein